MTIPSACFLMDYFMHPLGNSTLRGKPGLTNTRPSGYGLPKAVIAAWNAFAAHLLGASFLHPLQGLQFITASEQLCLPPPTLKSGWVFLLFISLALHHATNTCWASVIRGLSRWAEWTSPCTYEAYSPEELVIIIQIMIQINMILKLCYVLW